MTLISLVSKQSIIHGWPPTESQPKIKPFESSKVISFRNCFFDTPYINDGRKNTARFFFAVAANKPIEILCQITHPVFSLSHFSLCVCVFFFYPSMHTVCFMFMSHPWFFHTFTATDSYGSVFNSSVKVQF